MPSKYKLKRINIGLPSLYLKKLEKLSVLMGQSASPTAAYLIQTKLDELEREGKLDEVPDALADYVDVLSGVKPVECLDFNALSRITGKPVEILEATIEELINKGRESCCTEDCHGEIQECQKKQ